MAQDKYNRWICEACGFIYDEALGDPDSGLNPGTRYEEIPDDWECPVCGMRKSDLRLLTASNTACLKQNDKVGTASHGASRGGPNHIVVVGGGIAGWAVVEEIRRTSYSGPILLVSSCKANYYYKPSLSEALSSSNTDSAILYEEATTRADRLDIELLVNSTVIRLDTLKKMLVTSAGNVTYGKLVLAVGAHQRRLPIGGNASHDVRTLNDFYDYVKIQGHLGSGHKHVTILGAGLIGCEIADNIVRYGHEVIMLDPNQSPLSKLLPEEIGRELRSRLHKSGIKFHPRTTLSELDYCRDRYLAVLDNGLNFETDIVISAAGLIPNTGLAKRAGLKVDKGISVDLQMRTSDDHIYAVGDCASVDGSVYSYVEPIRRQARTIAQNLIGKKSSFQKLPVTIAVKTPSLPLRLCYIKPTKTKSWKLVDSDKDGWRMELTDEHGQLAAFVMAGVPSLKRSA